MSCKRFRLHHRIPALALLAAVSSALFQYASRSEAPFIIFLVVAGGWAITFAAPRYPERFRKGALLCASVFLCLATLETALYYASRSQFIITRTSPEEWRMTAMGFADFPLPDSSTDFREFLDGRLIGSVTYTFDRAGLRRIPGAAQGAPYKAAFFGCSYMFGHGVSDDETLPYYFVREAKGAFEGFNFAGEGWGPHQMLREIENGFVGQVVADAPDLAIYEAIPDHLRRVAGRAPWESGPKYELCGHRDACYTGPFHGTVYRKCRHWFDRSWTGRFFETHFAKLSRRCDIPLFLAVLRRTRSLFEKNGTRFVVVLWDRNELGAEILKVLRANHFEVIPLSTIIAETGLEDFALTQADQHPSPAANKAIAGYLWDRVGKPFVQQHPRGPKPVTTVLTAGQESLP